MIKLFTKDSFVYGVIIGILAIAALYGMLFYVSKYIAQIRDVDFLNRSFMVKIQLLAICLPLLLFRFFTINRNFERTGRGLLFIIFFAAILYFIINYRFLMH